jgi:hypothetical protein
MHRRNIDWWNTLDAVKEYLALTKYASVPRNATWPLQAPNGQKIGEWWLRQRKSYKTGLLLSDQVSALEQIGMQWDPRDVSWWANLKVAMNYIQVTGHTEVPQSAVCAWPG